MFPKDFGNDSMNEKYDKENDNKQVLMGMGADPGHEWILINDI